MINSKAIHILRTFSRNEIKQFSDFVSSPVYNKNKNLIKLFEILKDYHPGYDVEVQDLHKKIYPDSVFNNDNMKKLLSELLSVCESFLKFVRFEKEEFQNQFYLLKELQERLLDNQFLSNAKRLDAEIEDNNLYATHIQKSFLEDLKISFYLPRNLSFKSTGHFAVKSDCAMIYFLDALYSELDAVHLIKEDHNLKTQTPLSEYFVKNFSIDNFFKNLDLEKTENKLIYILLNFIKLSLNPEDSESFINAKEFLLKFPINSLKSCEDLIGLFDALYNHSAKMIIGGHEEFKDHMFKICQHKFELIKKFRMSSIIHWALFKNISTNAIEIGELEWAEMFIREYIAQIPSELQTDLLNYLYSFIEYRKGNYEKSLEYAARVNMNYHDLKIATKVVMLICFYELNEFESAISAIDAYKHFLNNNDGLDEGSKKRFNKFISVYSQLLKLKMNSESGDLFELEKITKELKDLRVKKVWAVAKINELEKIHNKKNRKKA